MKFKTFALQFVFIGSMMVACNSGPFSDPPLQLSEVKVIADQENIMLSWQSTGNSISSFDIYRQTLPKTSHPAAQEPVQELLATVTDSARSFVDQQPRAGAQYRYRVVARTPRGLTLDALSEPVYAPNTQLFLHRLDKTTYQIWTRPANSQWIVYSVRQLTPPVSGLTPPWALMAVRAVKMNQSLPASPGAQELATLPLAGNSVWEFALGEQQDQLQLHGDVFVGNQHGLDQLLSIEWILDGIKTTEIPIGAWAPAAELHMEQQDQIYSRWRSLKGPDALGPLPVILAKVNRHYIWNPQALEVELNLEFATDALMQRGYLAMAPLLRSTFTRAQLEGDPEVQDVSTAGFPERSGKSQSVQLWSTDHKVQSKMQILTLDAVNHWQASAPKHTFVANSSIYNKVYFTLYGTGAPAVAVARGDQLHSKWRWSATAELD